MEIKLTRRGRILVEGTAEIGDKTVKVMRNTGKKTGDRDRLTWMKVRGAYVARNWETNKLIGTGETKAELLANLDRSAL